MLFVQLYFNRYDNNILSLSCTFMVFSHDWSVKVLPVIWTKSGNFVSPPQKQTLTFDNWYPIFRLRAKASYIELNQYKWTVYIPTLLYKRGRLNDWYYCCKCYEDEIVDCRWDLPVELKSFFKYQISKFLNTTALNNLNVFISINSKIIGKNSSSHLLLSPFYLQSDISLDWQTVL